MPRKDNFSKNSTQGFLTEGNTSQRAFPFHFSGTVAGLTPCAAWSHHSCGTAEDSHFTSLASWTV